ncbi:ribonuclease 3 [Anabrus simplex]|uniref:ribonuclease 3 n=1 Tax=Anabrus simplex TaxID=316456 RepID=UPI0034DD63F8
MAHISTNGGGGGFSYDPRYQLHQEQFPYMNPSQPSGVPPPNMQPVNLPPPNLQPLLNIVSPPNIPPPGILPPGIQQLPPSVSYNWSPVTVNTSHPPPPSALNTSQPPPVDTRQPPPPPPPNTRQPPPTTINTSQPPPPAVHHRQPPPPPPQAQLDAHTRMPPPPKCDIPVNPQLYIPPYPPPSTNTASNMHVFYPPPAVMSVPPPTQTAWANSWNSSSLTNTVLQNDSTQRNCGQSQYANNFPMFKPNGYEEKSADRGPCPNVSYDHWNGHTKCEGPFSAHMSAQVKNEEDVTRSQFQVDGSGKREKSPYRSSRWSRSPDNRSDVFSSPLVRGKISHESDNLSQFSRDRDRSRSIKKENGHHRSHSDSSWRKKHQRSRSPSYSSRGISRPRESSRDRHRSDSRSRSRSIRYTEGSSRDRSRGNSVEVPHSSHTRSNKVSCSGKDALEKCLDSDLLKKSSEHRSRENYRRRSPSEVSMKKYLSPNRDLDDKETKDEKSQTEREILLRKWRENFCSNTKEMHKKLEELSKMKPEEILEHEKKVWTRSAPADLYYIRDDENPKVMRATPKLQALTEKFDYNLVTRAERVRQSLPKYEPPPRKNRLKLAKHKSEVCSSSDAGSGDSSCSSDDDEEDCAMEELERKRSHPDRLHPELWYNDPGEMNDGPLCRCSARARRNGMRHGIYAGETHLPKCNPDTNNADRLYHYRITISPPTNFLTKTPTIINHDEHEFIFEGFSMFSHFPLHKIPTCKVIRFNIEYTILYIEEKFPENFTIWELDLFHNYLFKELLELVDLDFKAYNDADGCFQFHFMPRFVRDLPDNGKEILSMNEVLQYLLNSNKPLIDETKLDELLKMPQFKWQNFADEVKGMVVTFPGKKPCSVRVDQLDRDQPEKNSVAFPEIVHFGIRPPQLSYAGNPDYQKAWRAYVKFRHLLANMAKPSFEDKRKLEAKENKLQEMRTQSKMKRDVTVAMSAKGFYRTGIMCDIIQHAMLIPVLVCHLRFHRSCTELENVINYTFKNRYLLQLALTHPSYRENFGTNPDHARNSLTNCGIRQPEYGDRRIHYMNTRKRGINTLINIMSRFGKKTETESNIAHNERLEFLGDAVVEFITSIHLFFMFPDLEEGGLATYRAAIVQNQHLALLSKTLNLEKYMLYAHGSDLCHDLELRHAMANCFEALMGALFLDGGIEVADKVFGNTLFSYEPQLLDVWENLSPHPLQVQEPLGDRKWISSFPILQKLTQFEKSIGVEFKHIRLLARAFTDRSIGYTNLTLGSNQRLEFLGDTVLQLIASDYLYKFFPEHHEGHLSLLRSSLVNNRTQAVVCNDLDMTKYALYANPKAELKTKDRADLLEAFLGALFVDQNLEPCKVFCNVCFFPRLRAFIMNQDWNDPKSKLQQCCLTLRSMDGGEPDIPLYKVIECKGPTNTRIYTVAVYFRGNRLAKASGHSIQQAEMSAAKSALENSHSLFPQLDHQKRVIAKSMKKQRWSKRTQHSSERRSPCSKKRKPEDSEKCQSYRNRSP